MTVFTATHLYSTYLCSCPTYGPPATTYLSLDYRTVIRCPWIGLRNKKQCSMGATI
ncbi:hypothetical protein ACS0TY_014334 [Phlomoides rotata]